MTQPIRSQTSASCESTTRNSSALALSRSGISLTIRGSGERQPRRPCRPGQGARFHPRRRLPGGLEVGSARPIPAALADHGTGLKERGVAFRSLTEQIDTTTPQGELLFHIFGALAQFERALIQERVQAGLAAARRRGRRGGRPVAIDAEKLSAVIAALDSGATKATVCRTFEPPTAQRELVRHYTLSEPHGEALCRSARRARPVPWSGRLASMSGCTA